MAERVRPKRGTFGARFAKVGTGTWLVLLVAGALLTAILVALVTSGRPATVGAQLRALPRAGQDTKRLPVSYDVSKPPRTEVECTVHAVGKDHGLVGQLIDIVPVRADGKTTTTRNVVVPTTARGVTAVVSGCHITARR